MSSFGYPASCASLQAHTSVTDISQKYYEHQLCNVCFCVLDRPTSSKLIDLYPQVFAATFISSFSHAFR